MGRLLVVVDYQNDFVKGALGFEDAKSLEDKIFDKVKTYLKNGDKVLFTYDTHFDNYLETREGKNLPIKHCICGSDGHALYGKLKQFKNIDNTIHYNKEAFGISPDSMICLYEEIGEVKEIEFVGIVTNMCVISNVVMFQSQYKNANIIVDGKLCSSFNMELHNKSLDVIEGLQVKVIR
ncbi:MAG: isochorismatase family cysteine hydrolase [Clostridium sp.]|uniref:cysteine hydrolase family protein n=1 Tax=Clostridium sp. TaxID=1506 RepID=UPI002FC647EB